LGPILLARNDILLAAGGVPSGNLNPPEPPYAHLAGGGCIPDNERPADTFPYTEHVETVILMTNSGFKDK
jgi:hypothetical protein